MGKKFENKRLAQQKRQTQENDVEEKPVAKINKSINKDKNLVKESQKQLEKYQNNEEQPQKPKNQKKQPTQQQTEKQLQLEKIQKHKEMNLQIQHKKCNESFYDFIRPDVEFLRIETVAEINQNIFDICKANKITPLQTVLDRWRWTNILEDTVQSQINFFNNNQGKKAQVYEHPDGMKPNLLNKIDGILQPTLLKQNMTEEKAKKFSEKVQQIILEGINKIQQKQNEKYAGQVVIEDFQKTHKKIFLVQDKQQPKNRSELAKITNEHYEKLNKMFKKANNSLSKKKIQRRFPDYLFVLLARYQSYQSSGNQAAIPDQVFRILQSEFGVQTECFASPMNCYLKNSYCSAFNDTDMPFGSIGSFFCMFPTQEGGSFQANPPFIPALMEKMVDHIEKVMPKATSNQKPLSFCVIVPVNKDKPYYERLESSKYQKGHFIVKSEQHYYKDGLQHQNNKTAQSTCDTAFFFLQNELGSQKWSFTQRREILIRKGMKIEDGEGLDKKKEKKEKKLQKANAKQEEALQQPNKIEKKIKKQDKNNNQEEKPKKNFIPAKKEKK